MPIYEYECKKCKKQFEIQRGFHEEGDVLCPECSGKGQRIYSAPPLIFKGSGFYVTDHKKKEERPAEGQAAKADTDKATKKSGSTEAKAKPAAEAPAAKTEPSKTPPKSETGKS